MDMLGADPASSTAPTAGARGRWCTFGTASGEEVGRVADRRGSRDEVHEPRPHSQARSRSARDRDSVALCHALHTRARGGRRARRRRPTAPRPRPTLSPAGTAALAGDDPDAATLMAPPRMALAWPGRTRPGSASGSQSSRCPTDRTARRPPGHPAGGRVKNSGTPTTAASTPMRPARRSGGTNRTNSHPHGGRAGAPALHDRLSGRLVTAVLFVRDQARRFTRALGR